MLKGALVAGAAGGDLAVTAPGTAMSVNLATGVAYNYGFFYENTATLAKAIAASDPTLNRIDTVIIQLLVASNTVLSAVKQGTLASSPVPPTLIQNNTEWDIPLCDVRVNAGVTTIVTANLTDRRPFVGTKFNPAVMGPGSGINADKLDGADSTAFAQTDGTVTRVIAVTGSQPTNATGNNGDLIVWY